MRIPSNIIKTNYTAGNEYMYSTSHKIYQGYYYEMNGRFFAGKEFKPNSPEIIKIEPKNINTLLTQASTYVYGLLSKSKLNSYIPPSIISTGNINSKTRYFYKKTNVTPTLIREINKDTFDSLRNNPIYQTISILFPEGGYFGGQESLDEAEKQMPGIKTFILSELPPD